MEQRDPLLVEREKTHGSFAVVATNAQRLKYILRGNTSWDGFPPEQHEALEMIATKIGRILSGQANFKDHWDDIAGYAKLGSEACD